MFPRIRTNTGTQRKSILVCHNIRVKGGVVQKIVKHFGHSSDANEQKELFEKAMKWIDEHGRNWIEKHLPSRKQLKMKHKVSLLNLQEEKRLNVGIPDIFGVLYERLGFSRLLTGAHADTLKKVIFARLLEPGSKRRLSVVHEDKFGSELPVDRIYRMMDVLSEKNEEILKCIFEMTKSSSGGKISLLLFDVTTLWFETISEDDIRNFGFSKDHRFNTTQVVLALATTEDGLPVGYKLFPGNTAEVTTLVASIKEWKSFISIDNVMIIGDRGMMSEGNIDYFESNEMDYVVAYPLRKAKKRIKEEILNLGEYVDMSTEGEIGKFKEIKLEEERRLIVSYNSKRSEKDKKDRDRLIEKLEKKLSSCKNPKRLINNKGYLKYTTISGESIATVDKEKIKLDAMWDGFHGVLTNSREDAQSIYARYRNLWVIEESFRINKHSLKMRPIYHFSTERIETHVAICYMNFSMIRHAQFHLKKVGLNFSAERIVNALRDVQASVFKDITTDNFYKLMSRMSEDAQAIYDAFSVKKEMTAVQLNSM